MMTSQRITVLLADDHALMRAGLRALLAQVAACEIVAEAADGIDASRLIRQLQPTVALVDLTMPGLSGLDVIARAVREAPDTRCLALSMHTAENYVLEALRAGAAGYVVKDSAPEELAAAIRSVAGGGTHLSPAITARLGPDLLEQLRSSGGETPRPLDQLTPRQRQILQLVAEGHSTRRIADRLSISVKTVETHRAQIMERLGIRDVAGLTRYALRNGLISAE
jgi:DNA-binding NarL/FixJ family response regulator